MENRREPKARIARAAGATLAPALTACTTGGDTDNDENTLSRLQESGTITVENIIEAIEDAPPSVMFSNPQEERTREFLQAVLNTDSTRDGEAL